MNPLQLLSGLKGQILNTVSSLQKGFQDFVQQHQPVQQPQQPGPNLNAQFRLFNQQPTAATSAQLKPAFTADNLEKGFNYLISGSSKVKDAVFKTFSGAANNFTQDFQTRLGRVDQRYIQPVINYGQDLTEFAQGKGPRAENFRNSAIAKMTPEDLAMNFSPMGVTNVAGNIAQRAAKAKLGGLINYSNDLLKMGYKKEQIEKISYNGYLNILKNQPLLSNEKIQGFKNIFNAWIGQRDVAKTIGTEYGAKLRNIPAEKGMQIIHFLENPTSKVGPEIKDFAAQIKKEFDSLFLEANRGGVSTRYLKDYISHIWKETPQEIQEAFQHAGTTFKFAKERRIPTYAEGIAAGLKPLFTHPAQIIEAYTTKLYQTKANIELLDSLKKAGFIADKAQPGYMPIVAPGIKDGLFAPTQIAQHINRMFSPEDTGKLGAALDIGRKVSGKIQDITMSGGIPKTAANAFTFAQLTKEVLAGRIGSPLMSFIRSMSGNASLKFFEQNAEQIKKMQARNVPVNTSFNASNLIDKGVIKNIFGEGIGEAWNKTVNEPTFGRLMPMLQINLFNDVERGLLKAGKDPKLAADIAAKAVSNFYGIVNSGTQAMRTKLSQDAIGTFTFAPKYRESMVNFWINNLKALKNPLAPENRTNTKFIIGAILTYVGMDQVNKAFNGHGMQDNPTGKKDKLLIPLSDGYTLGIPFLSSIATVPRTLFNMTDSAVHGDVPEALNQSKMFLSSLVKPPLDVITNQNFFGGQIYQPGTGLEQVKDIGAYMAGAYSHPYIRAGIQKIQGKTPDYQIGLQALELPLRFYKTSSIANSNYFEAKNKLDKSLTEDQKKIVDYLTTSQKNGGPNSDDKASLLLKNQFALDYYKKLQLASDPQNPLYTRDDNFIKGYLAYQLATDSKQKAQIRIAFPEIPTVQYQLAQKFSENTDKPISGPSPIQQLTPEQVKIVSAYTALPQGSIQRKQLLAANPWLKDYWNQNTSYYQANPIQATGPLADYLKSIGVDPNTQQASTGTGYGGFKPISKTQAMFNALKPKATLKKVSLKMPKPKKFKAPKVKVAKLPKYKQPVFKPLKPIKLTKKRGGNYAS